MNTVEFKYKIGDIFYTLNKLRGSVNITKYVVGEIRVRGNDIIEYVGIDADDGEVVEVVNDGNALFLEEVIDYLRDHHSDGKA